MTGASTRDSAAPKPARIAIVIGDAAMRSRVAAALVLEGVDVAIAPSLDHVRDGVPAVTDRLCGNDGEPGPLSAISIVRDATGGIHIRCRVSIAGIDAKAIVRAANDFAAGDGSSPG